MRGRNRRGFLQTSAALLGAGVSAFAGLAMGASLRPGSGDRSPIQTPAVGKDQSKRPLGLGLIIAIGSDPNSAMAKERSLELTTAQTLAAGITVALDTTLRKA